MADIFISYSKAYAEVTQRLADELERMGLSVWWDTELVAGESYRQRIQQEINSARAAIVIWTPDSITSEFVISEASRAHAQRKLIQVRTGDVEVKDIPPPFDVSHVALVDDRKSITGALRRLGVMDGARGKSSNDTAQAWAEPVHRARRASYLRWMLPIGAGAAGLAAFGYLGVTQLNAPTPAPSSANAQLVPVIQATTVTLAEDPSKQALTVSGEFLKQLNAGVPDTTLFASDVRLGQRGLMGRSEAADEFRKFGQRYARVNCRHDIPYVELRQPEQSSSSFRAKVSVLCDLTDKLGRTLTKRFPLELEVVRADEALRIAGLWQPEEMVLWQRRERGK